MREIRRLCLLLALVLAAGVFIGGQPALADDGPLVVGVRDDIVNFGFLNDTTGKYYGLEIDLAKELASRLERVEAILAEELPHIKERVPAITDGPYYKGVSSLADSGVILKVIAQCSEGNRISVVRALNREMKLIFDKHKINVPFPQVVVNQPVEFMEATEWQKRQAEKFAAEQQERTKDMELTV